MICKEYARLIDLRRDTIFWLNGKKARLLYANECRARVRLEDKKETDWSPKTIVEIEVNRRNVDFGDL